MDLTIRSAVPLQDFESVAALLTICEGEPVSKARLMEGQQPIADGEIRQQWVAELNHSIIGYGTVFQTPWMKAGRFLLKLWTIPDQRKQGIGTQMYNTLTAFVQSHGAQSLESNLFDNDPESLRFAQTRGFTIERHLFESVIDLNNFDAQPFEGIMEQVQASGIRLFSLADVGSSPENLRKLWQVNYTTYMDDPGSTGTFPTFDEFQKMTGESAWFKPAGQFLAADGDRYIGLSAIRYFPDTNACYNLMTGVLPAYRGRKIALALKLMTIHYARQLAADTIRTDNDSQNAPMLAINRKLGYQPQPGVYRLAKEKFEG